MDIVYFRPQREGPESTIEKTVLSQLSELFPVSDQLSWTAGSVPIGAGIPDIVLISFKPEVYALCNVDVPKARVLAYLRAVRCAKAETIANRVGQPQEIIVHCLSGMVEMEIVSQANNVYSLSTVWKDILPEIITIEAKVLDWRRAVAQAARNRVFAHRSFVALPVHLAMRVSTESVFRLLGIGILGVTAHDDVRVLRGARRFRPRIWDYYYRLAELTAEYVRSNRCHLL